MIRDGGVRHIQYIPESTLSFVMKLQYVNQTFGILCVWFGKISVALLLLRLIETTSIWRRWFLWACVAIYSVLICACLIVEFAHCAPVKALWQLQLLRTGRARCWDPKVMLNVNTAQGGKPSILERCRIQA